MGVQGWTLALVGVSFTLYIGIALRSRAGSTGEFYVAGRHVHPALNGMATAADWMSAASFISMAGIIAFIGRDGTVYLMGWTGGYVLLALLLAPYLRRFGKFTVPDFVGDRYYSNTARVVAIVCALFVSFTYVAGQMRGVGIVFSRFLEVEVNTGVIIGMGIVFLYAVLGGMKGITYTQVAQYWVLITAFLIPAIFVSMMMTGQPVPQLGFGSRLEGSEVYLLERLDELCRALGFDAYTSGRKTTLDVYSITLALMAGTAGLPHVIVRFFTVPNMAAARTSAAWALAFIALLYTTAPAVAAYARTNLLETLPGTPYVQAPDWFKTWEKTGLVRFEDHNGDGRIQHCGPGLPDCVDELTIDRDIIVLASPEIARLPAWVVGLVAAGALAAALSTAAGLLLVISSAISHDLLKRTLRPAITERQELLAARLAAAGAVGVAGYFGINPPGFVAQVVALAFGLAAATFFPVLVLGILWKRMNREGAVAGMLTGLAFTVGYIVYFKFLHPELDSPEHWWLGISPEGIGAVGMILNVVVAVGLSLVFRPPPAAVQAMVEDIRRPAPAPS